MIPSTSLHRNHAFAPALASVVHTCANMTIALPLWVRVHAQFVDEPQILPEGSQRGLYASDMAGKGMTVRDSVH
jgi:hypothetical protein